MYAKKTDVKIIVQLTVIVFVLVACRSGAKADVCRIEWIIAKRWCRTSTAVAGDRVWWMEG